MKKIFLIFLIISIISVYAKIGIGEQKLFVNFLPPSLTAKDRIDITFLVIDPIEEDYLWVSGINGETYRYDKRKNEWFDLVEKIGKYSYGIGGNIIFDKFNKNYVWFGNFRKGVTMYDRKSDKWETFSIKGYRFAVSKNYVWAGGTDGLFKYDRKKKNWTLVEKTKGLWITSLFFDDNILWMGIWGKGIMKFDIKSNKVEMIEKLNGHKVSGCGQILKTKNLLWFNVSHYLACYDKKQKKWKSYISTSEPDRRAVVYNIHSMYYDKKNNAVYFGSQNGLAIYDIDQGTFDKKFKGLPTSIAGDKDYIWFTDYSGLLNRCDINRTNFMVYSKNLQFKVVVVDDDVIWVGGHQGIFRIDKDDSAYITLEEKERLVKEAGNLYNQAYLKLRDESDPIEFIRIKYRLLEQYTLTSLGDRERNFYDLMTGLARKNEDDIPKFKEFLNKNPDSKMNEAIYFGLGAHFYLLGEITESLKWFEALLKDYPNSEFFKWSQMSSAKLKEYKIYAERIKNINEKYMNDEPRRLWELGKAYMPIMKQSWNVKEVGYNMDYPFQFFEKLIAKYPDNEWADNADYEMLRYSEGLSHEGGDNEHNPYFIGQYRAMINKYPNSELVPQMYLDIARLQFYYIYPYQGGSFQEKHLEHIKKSLDTYKRVITKYPNTEYAEKAIKSTKEIKEFMKKHFDIK